MEILTNILMQSKIIQNFDIVLVDARWRVACALKALEYISDDTIVFMHDMDPRRIL